MKKMIHTLYTTEVYICMYISVGDYQKQNAGLIE